MSKHLLQNHAKIGNIYIDNWTVCADYLNVLAQRHICGVHTQGAVTPHWN